MQVNDNVLSSYASHSYICGVDEAGRGPLAGDVYAAAVILDPNQPIKGLKDSKLLSEKQRDTLYEEIVSTSYMYAVGVSTVEEIDSINILNASLLAMQRAILTLLNNLKIGEFGISPSIILIDGNKAPKNLDDIVVKTIVGGDALIPEISAASIIAKVERDRAMYNLDVAYPEYQFGKHKGYGTKKHLEAISKYGVLTGIHRTSFAPIKAKINN